MIQHGDILLNKEGDLDYTLGDIIVGDASSQIVGAISQSINGNFVSYPTLGANIPLQLDGVTDTRDVVADLTQAMRLDGWKIHEMDILTEGEKMEVSILSASKITDQTKSLY